MLQETVTEKNPSAAPYLSSETTRTRVAGRKLALEQREFSSIFSICRPGPLACRMSGRNQIETSVAPRTVFIFSLLG